MRFRHIAFVFAVTSLGAAAHAADTPLVPGEVPAADMERAKEILKKWEDESPEKVERKLVVCYWTPADREPLEDRHARLSGVLAHIRDFYGRQMDRHGFEDRVQLRLKYGDDGIMFTDVQGELRDAECANNAATADAIRKDCLAALKVDGEKETLLIFCNLSTWDQEKNAISQHSPYFASGDATHGTAFVVDSPLLDAKRLTDTEHFIEDGQYGPISLGRYNSIFMGGVTHELGHALGLPHCKETADQRREDGHELMGDGNRTYGEEFRGEGRGSFLGAADALKLAAHPVFSGSVKGLAGHVDPVFSDWVFTPRDNGLEVAAKVRADVPVHAVLAYADPDDNFNYDSEVGAGVPDGDGKFRLLLPSIEHLRNTYATLHFVAVCANGAAGAGIDGDKAFTFTVPVDDQGHLDIAGLNLGAILAWAAVDHDHLAGKLPPGSAARAALPGATQELLRRLEAPDTAEKKATPGAVMDAVKEIPLSDCAPTTASTGWRGVHYDRTGEGGALVGSDGPARHGLWAHADSEYVYDLGGRWTRFKGRCAPLNKAKNGEKLRFSIVADGNTVWTSPGGNVGPFSYDLDVTGVKALTVRCEADDKNGAWGGWLEPVLKR